MTNSKARLPRRPELAIVIMRTRTTALGEGADIGDGSKVRSSVTRSAARKRQSRRKAGRTCLCLLAGRSKVSRTAGIAAETSPPARDTHPNCQGIFSFGILLPAYRRRNDPSDLPGSLKSWPPPQHVALAPSRSLPELLRVTSRQCRLGRQRQCPRVEPACRPP